MLQGVMTTSAESVSKPTGAGTPADALGVTKRMSESDSDGKESYECPSCDRVFDTVRGRSVHHKRSHGDSIAGVQTECHQCGSTFRTGRSKIENAEHNFCGSECMHEWQRETWHGENAAGWKGGKVTVECAQCSEPARELTPAHAERQENHFCSQSCRSDYYNGGFIERDYGVDPGDLLHTLHWVEGMSANEMSAIFGTSHYTVISWMDYRGVEHRNNTEANRKLAAERDNYDELVKAAHEATREMVDNGEHHLLSKNRGGAHLYGKLWDERRQEALERDGYECQECGMTAEQSREWYGRGLDVHHITPAAEFDDPDERHQLDNLVSLCRTCHRRIEST